MNRYARRFLWVAAVLVGLAARPGAAANFAVFGDNTMDNYLTSIGHATTLVTDAQLATAGFIDSFDALVMTRNGFSFGSGLSAAAAARVMTYVGAVGNVVLLNGDFADAIADADANIQTLVANAASFVANGNRGFLGEFNGAVSGLTSNGNGFTPLGFIPGAAGATNFGNGGTAGSFSLAPAGVGHSAMGGVTTPYNPGSVEFGASIAGVPASYVLATWDGGVPAVMARGGVAPTPVPEPGTLALLAGGGAMFLRRRRERRSG